MIQSPTTDMRIKINHHRHYQQQHELIAMDASNFDRSDSGMTKHMTIADKIKAVKRQE